MTQKRSDDLRELHPEKRQALLIVAPNEDGTYSDMFGRQYSQADLAAYGSRVMIWQQDKPREVSHSNGTQKKRDRPTAFHRRADERESLLFARGRPD